MSRAGGPAAAAGRAKAAARRRRQELRKERNRLTVLTRRASQMLNDKNAELTDEVREACEGLVRTAPKTIKVIDDELEELR